MDGRGRDGQAGFTVVSLDDGDRALRACIALAPGEILVTFTVAAFVPRPTRYSIQLGISQHALIEPESLRFLNHSCDPNLALDARSLALKAIRPIEPGHELTYFYPSTEWEMAEPFVCHCRTPRCLQRVAGAAHVPAGLLVTYELADHINVLLEQRRGKRTPARETLGKGLPRA